MTKIIIPVTAFNESNPLSIKSKINPKEIIIEKERFKNVLTVNISAKNKDKKKDKSWERVASVIDFG